MSLLVNPAVGGGASSSATVAAQYLVLTGNATLTGERIFAPAQGLGATDGGANGNYSLSMTSRVQERSAVSIVATISSTLTLKDNLVQYIIPPNTLGTDKGLEIVAFGEFGQPTASLTTWSFAVMLGATVMFADAFIFTSQTAAQSQAWLMKLRLFSEGATNAQLLVGISYFGSSLGATTGIGELGGDELSSSGRIMGTAALDSTTTLTFQVNMVFNGAVGTSRSFMKRYHMVRLM
jgi:hypothetical protein